MGVTDTKFPNQDTTLELELLTNFLKQTSRSFYLTLRALPSAARPPIGQLQKDWLAREAGLKFSRYANGRP